MFDLRITTASDGRHFLAKRWPTCAVSLIGETLRFPLDCYGDHHLILKFDDTEMADDRTYVAPTIEHVRAVLAHTAHLQEEDRLLVHCHAGKSRSTAMSIAILIQHGLTPQAAFDRVREIRDCLIPNRLMIALIDDEQGLEGELVRVVDDYYETLLLPGVTLPDRGGWNV